MYMYVYTMDICLNQINNNNMKNDILATDPMIGQYRAHVFIYFTYFFSGTCRIEHNVKLSRLAKGTTGK